MKTGVVHLSSVHHASDTRIYHKECRTLADAGYRVTLVARRPKSELDDDRIMYVEFSTSRNRASRMLLGTLKMLAVSIRLDEDIYHFHDPELMPVGLVLKVLGKRVVYDVHEDIPAQILTKTWIPSFLRRPVSRLVSWAHRLSAMVFDRIVLARKDAASAFPRRNLVLIENYPLMSEFQSGKMEHQQKSSDPYRVVYVGGLSQIRGIHEMVEAIKLASEKYNVRLELAGPFQPESLYETIHKIDGWERVNFHGWINRKQMSEILSSSIAGLLPFHPVPNHITSYPNKLFEYMSAGLPVIASNFDYWKQFVTDAGTGIMIDPMDPQSIADAIEWIIENPDNAKAMGERGRKAILSKFNWDREAEKLIGMYRTLLGDGQAGEPTKASMTAQL